VVINDNTIGQKRGDTQTKSQFDLLAGITNFFGIETSKWESNNEGLDSSALIKANTESEYKGTANIQRQGSLQAQLSAVILELLPNGVLRLEGSKIVSINSEEEIMVISGLVRQRDISSDNKVDSNRLANMRIDFYGHGNLSEAQSPGWGARLTGSMRHGGRNGLSAFGAVWVEGVGVFLWVLGHLCQAGRYSAGERDADGGL
jgi:flagellar L-ring protein precursor FlgH